MLNVLLRRFVKFFLSLFGIHVSSSLSDSLALAFVLLIVFVVVLIIWYSLVQTFGFVGGSISILSGFVCCHVGFSYVTKNAMSISPIFIAFTVIFTILSAIIVAFLTGKYFKREVKPSTCG